MENNIIGFRQFVTERGEDSKGHFIATEKGAGMTEKGVKAFRASHPGSKLQTAVTGKVKAGSKDAKRRKSFCARMSGMKKKLTSAKTANDPNSRINKSLRAWKC